MQLLRQLIPPKRLAKARVFRHIGVPSRAQKRCDLPLQPALLRDHTTIAHRLALARIRSNLRPIYRQRPEPRQTQLPRQTHHLHEQPLEVLKVPAAKRAQRPVARKVPCSQNPKRHILLQLPRNPPRRKYPRRVAVKQNLDHHPRLIRRVATTVPLIRSVKRRQIQGVHQVADVMRKMPGRAANRAGPEPTTASGPDHKGENSSALHSP